MICEYSMASEEPTFVFFRNRPDGLAEKPPLASSMQSLETSFFLIALYRYPHALSTCASAIEAAVKASPACASEGSGLQAQIGAARRHSASIAANNARR